MYHYTECGLDNVWLENGFVERDTPYGKGIAVRNADDLHAQIAKSIAHGKKKVSGKELRFLRCLLGLSQDNFGKTAGVSEQAVSLWERTGKVPKNADFIIKMLVMGKLEGNKTVTDALAAINGVDRVINQRIVFHESRSRWKAERQTASTNDANLSLAA